jgi:hypothetical protein
MNRLVYIINELSRRLSEPQQFAGADPLARILVRATACQDNGCGSAVVGGAAQLHVTDMLDCDLFTDGATELQGRNGV